MGENIQWTVFIYMAWYALSCHCGATQIKAKYIGVLEVIRLVCDCFGIEVHKINSRPEDYGITALTYVPQYA